MKRSKPTESVTRSTAKRSTRSYTLVSDSAEGVRVPFNREAAKEIARRIGRGSRLTALS